jgi:hypothetical protein
VRYIPWDGSDGHSDVDRVDALCYAHSALAYDPAAGNAHADAHP